MLFVVYSSWSCRPLHVIIYCSILQSDDDCCNNCEEVREAYRKKGWALSNPDLIDQVVLPLLNGFSVNLICSLKFLLSVKAS